VLRYKPSSGEPAKASPPAPAAPSPVATPARPVTREDIAEIKQLWGFYPGKRAEWIAMEFQRRTGRSIAPTVALMYQPEDED
jgi:hypothetical protein